MCHLHSTIFILILKEEEDRIASNRNLHSTIFILIHVAEGLKNSAEKFTFYYIYINTGPSKSLSYQDFYITFLSTC